MLDAEPLEQAPSLFQRLIQKGSAVEVQQVEDHQDHGHLAAQLVRDLLSPQPALELEETQHVTISMSQDLAVEKDGMAETWRALGQLGERTRRLFQVAREELDSTIGMMELATDAVVFLLGPHLVRAHALECLGDGGLNEALAQADAHLARDDLDHEARRLRMKTAQELLERRGLGRPAGCAERLQGRR